MHTCPLDTEFLHAGCLHKEVVVAVGFALLNWRNARHLQ